MIFIIIINWKIMCLNVLKCGHVGSRVNDWCVKETKNVYLDVNIFCSLTWPHSWVKKESDPGQWAELCCEQWEPGVENIVGAKWYLCQFIKIWKWSSSELCTPETSKAVFCFSLCLVWKQLIEGYICAYVFCICTCVRAFIVIESQNPMYVGDLP